MRIRWAGLLGIIAVTLAAWPSWGNGAPAQPLDAAGRPDAGTLILVADPWCPYNCDPSVDGREGYMIEVARAVFEPLGYRIDYVLESWTMALRLAEEGKVTAAVGAGPGDAGSLILPVRELGRSSNAIAARKDDPFRYTGPDSLAGRRMAVIRDYSYSEELDDYIARYADDPGRISVLSGFGYAQLTISLRRLLGGDFDLVVDDANVLEWAVERLKLKDKVALQSLDDPEPVYIAFSPRIPEGEALAATLSDGIDRLRRDGTLARILASYGLKDWAAPAAPRTP